MYITVEIDDTTWKDFEQILAGVRWDVPTEEAARQIMLIALKEYVTDCSGCTMQVILALYLLMRLTRLYDASDPRVVSVDEVDEVKGGNHVR